MKNHNATTPLALVVGAIVLGLVSAAQAAPTRLQVFVSKEEKKAGEVLARIDKAGYGPGLVEKGAKGYLVMTREFPSLAEANFAKPELRNAGFNDVFAVLPDSGGKATRAIPQAEVPRLTETAAFKHFEVDFKIPAEKTPAAAEPSAKDAAALSEVEGRIKQGAGDKQAQAKLQRAYLLLRSGDRDGARAQFESVAREHPKATEGGEAKLRLAYMLVGDKAPSAKCLGAFREIASGKVPATGDVRAEAMLRTAALYHRGKDLDMAAASYAAVERASRNPEVKAFAKVQQAGLALEQAWNGKGTFADARALCDEVLSKHGSADKQTRATATLMAMETLAYEKKYDEVLARSKDFTRDFSDLPESPLGYYWIGKALLETGDTEGAITVLESVERAKFPTDRRFKQVDVTPAARLLAADAHEKAGNSAKANELRRRVNAD